MTTETKARYNFYPTGTFSIIEGRLGAEPEIKVLESGKRLVKLNIATNAGSKKKEDGSYDYVTEWSSVTIWENGGESTLLIDTIANPPSDKLVFGKGHSVILYAHIISNLRVYNDKPFRDITVTQFHHLYKTLGQKPSESNNNGTSENGTKSSEVPEVDTPDIPF